jgi:hypothetical protein
MILSLTCQMLTAVPQVARAGESPTSCALFLRVVPIEVGGFAGRAKDAAQARPVSASPLQCELYLD